MSILNQNLEWSQIDPGVAAAFRGVPVKVLIEPGRTLCRFITTESVKKGIRGNETFKSPWWMDWKYTASLLSRWQNVRTNVAPKDVIRGVMAVPLAFSQQLDSFVQIILNKPVYAFKGIARYQNDAQQNLTYIGGGEQFFLPNLASDAEGFSSSVAYLHCFSSIDSLD